MSGEFFEVPKKVQISGQDTYKVRSDIIMKEIYSGYERDQS